MILSAVLSATHALTSRGGLGRRCGKVDLPGVSAQLLLEALDVGGAERVPGLGPERVGQGEVQGLALVMGEILELPGERADLGDQALPRSLAVEHAFDRAPGGPRGTGLGRHESARDAEGREREAPRRPSVLTIEREGQV